MKLSAVIRFRAAFLGCFIGASIIFSFTLSSDLFANRSSQSKVNVYNEPGPHKLTTMQRSKDRSPDPSFNLDLDPDKKFIIIVSGFRSGSSFLGSMFDGNPALHYMFEPFHGSLIRTLHKKSLIIGGRADHTESDLRILYLQQILHNCTAYPTIFPETYKWCGTVQEHLHRFNNASCDEKPPKLANPAELLSFFEICKYRKTTAIKVIRLQDLSDIFKISKVKSANIKIVHLLRHPVALLLSRRQFGEGFDWEETKRIAVEIVTDVDVSQIRTTAAFEAFKYCSDQLKILESVDNDPWLKERYERVTHTQISLEPLKTARKVYSSVNETLTTQVIEHITNVSQGKSSGCQKDCVASLNVHKNSSDIVDKWKELKSRRQRVRFWDVFSIEAQCRRLFGPLGQTFSTDSLSRRKFSVIFADINDELDRRRAKDLLDNVTIKFTSTIEPSLLR